MRTAARLERRQRGGRAVDVVHAPAAPPGAVALLLARAGSRGRGARRPRSRLRRERLERVRGHVLGRRVDDVAEVAERELVEPRGSCCRRRTRPSRRSRTACRRSRPARAAPRPRRGRARAARARRPPRRRRPGRGRSRTRRPSRRARGRAPDAQSPATVTSSREQPLARLHELRVVGGHAARAQREDREAVSQTGDWHASGRSRSPSSTRKPLQPSTARRRHGSSKPAAERGEHEIDQTHGGWMPPQLPSASWRSRTHCSAVAIARRRSGVGRGGGDGAPCCAPISRRSTPAGRPAEAPGRPTAARPSGAPSTRSCRSRTARRRERGSARAGSARSAATASAPSSARKHFVKTRLRATPPSRGCTRASRRPASTPAIFSATYDSIVVERSAGPSNQFDHVPSSRRRASSSFASGGRSRGRAGRARGARTGAARSSSRSTRARRPTSRLVLELEQRPRRGLDARVERRRQLRCDVKRLTSARGASARGPLHAAATAPSIVAGQPRRSTRRRGRRSAGRSARPLGLRDPGRSGERRVRLAAHARPEELRGAEPLGERAGHPVDERASAQLEQLGHAARRRRSGTGRRPAARGRSARRGRRPSARRLPSSAASGGAAAAGRRAGGRSRSASRSSAGSGSPSRRAASAGGDGDDERVGVELVERPTRASAARSAPAASSARPAASPCISPSGRSGSTRSLARGAEQRRPHREDARRRRSPRRSRRFSAGRTKTSQKRSIARPARRARGAARRTSRRRGPRAEAGAVRARAIRSRSRARGGGSGGAQRRSADRRHAPVARRSPAGSSGARRTRAAFADRGRGSAGTR